MSLPVCLRPDIAVERDDDPRTAFTAAYGRGRCSPSTSTNTGIRTNENTCHHAKDSAADAKFCNLYKSRKTKSCILLILCAILLIETSSGIPVASSGQRLILHTSQYRQRYHQQLLQQQRSQVQPIPHRHHLHLRSVANMTDPSDNSNSQLSINNYTDCNIAEALSNPWIQANKSYTFIRGLLWEYTNHRYMQNPEDAWVTYQKYEIQLTHPFANHLLRDLDVKPNLTHFQSLLQHQTNTQLEIIHIIQNVYITLKTLRNALEDVMSAYTYNDLYKGALSKERLIGVNNFFIKLNTTLGVDLQETKDAMDKLHIQIPSVERIKYEIERGEWPLVREHLSFMQYLQKLYEILLSKCAPKAN